MTQRPYDVILYGASGFVGKQTVAYFAKHTDSPQIHWAISGRNQAKLEKVRQEVGVEVDIIPAEANDLEALASLVSQTRVLLNTAGPFALYGNAIVDACVRFGTHYVDITGETPWVKGLIDRCPVAVPQRKQWTRVGFAASYWGRGKAGSRCVG